MRPLSPEFVRHDAIDSLQWDCRFADQDLAHALQSRLSAFLNGPARQTMQTLFQRICAADEVWSMDSLEVELGTLDAQAGEEQWTHRFEQALWDSLLRKRQALGGPLASARTSIRSAAEHDLDNFLFYLEHGHLPWSMSPLAGHLLADWLARLAHGTGPRLWNLLQQLHPGNYILARLSQIAPHQGLHALLAIRHADLAAALCLLDQHILAPLRARGRLSDHQARQIQQRWRVAGLAALWNEQASQLSTLRLQQLIASLSEAVSAQLGRHWIASLPAPLRLWRSDTASRSELSYTLLAGVSGLDDAPGGANASDAPNRGLSDAANARQLLDHAWQRLDAALSSPQAVEPAALLALMQTLAAWNPAALGLRLHRHAQKRANRLAWLGTLGCRALWLAMQHLGREAPREGEAGPNGATADAAAWSESLRQFSLAALRAPAWRAGPNRLGLSSLQGWLVDYTLRYLALGHPLPQDHVAWQALWRNALAELSEGPERPPARRDAANPRREQANPDLEAEAEARVRPSSALLDAVLSPSSSGLDECSRLSLFESLADPATCSVCLARTTAPQRWQLIHALLPQRATALRPCSERLARVFVRLFPTVPPEEAEARHWNFLFGHLFLAGLPPTPDSLTRRFAMHLAHYDRDQNGQAAAPLRSWFARLSAALSPATRMAREDRSGSGPSGGNERELPDGLRQAPSRAEQQESRLPPSRRPAFIPFAVSLPPASARLDEVLSTQAPIPVANAGLVLLSAYAGRLFSMLDLVRGGLFVDEASQTRAIHCLAYLSDGHGGGNETQWALNKLLCGVPLNRPVPPAPDLDAPTREILDGLLEAVIAHWKILGSTSVAGLRETFLQRRGRLSHELGGQAPHWKLKVAPAPFDMLLDQLPWSYSTIKASWMEEVLYVDWR